MIVSSALNNRKGAELLFKGKEISSKIVPTFNQSDWVTLNVGGQVNGMLILVTIQYFLTLL